MKIEISVDIPKGFVVDEDDWEFVIAYLEDATADIVEDHMFRDDNTPEPKPAVLAKLIKGGKK